MESILYSIGMQDIGHFEGKYSGTTFLGVLIIFILRIHLRSVEDAEILFEGGTVQSHEPGEHLSFSLEGEFIQGISVQKGSFLGGMPVQVKIVQ